MKRRWAFVSLAVLIIAGVASGFAATSAFTDATGSSSAPATTTTPRAASTAVPPSTTTTSLRPATTTPPKPTQGLTLLAWTAGGLPSGFGESVAAIDGLGRQTAISADAVAMVAAYADSDTPLLELTDGWRIELDTLAVDPTGYATFAEPADRELIAGLSDDEALLTTTSAELRSLGVEGRLVLETGQPLRVVGVISDVSGAGAELIVNSSTGATLGVTTPRFLLAELAGDRAVIEANIRNALDQRVPLRLRVTGESPFLRHGDAVLTQAGVKAIFGEFAFRDLARGRGVEIDPQWLAENIVEADLPLLGVVQCHRLMVDIVRDAFDELVAMNQGHLVNPTQFGGCFGSRRIAEGQPLSRHAWGIALDLNIDTNPRGNFSTQDPRLVETLESAGLAWGGHWLVPDPGHYEFRTAR